MFIYKYTLRKAQPEIDYEGVLKEVEEFERVRILGQSMVDSEKDESNNYTTFSNTGKAPA
jgi:hypothetical protein